MCTQNELRNITQKELGKIFEKEGIDPQNIQQTIVDLLCKKGLKLATAESCTGGLISEKITSVSGSSSVFDCGVCSYANEIKHKVLGVKRKTLESFGAVSPQTAVEMAQGVRLLSGADIGVSTTGIAGPTGGTKEKPVGLVYMAVSTEDKLYSVRLDFSASADAGDSRTLIRNLACSAVLCEVLSLLRG